MELSTVQEGSAYNGHFDSNHAVAVQPERHDLAASGQTPSAEDRLLLPDRQQAEGKHVNVGRAVRQNRIASQPAWRRTTHIRARTRTSWKSKIFCSVRRASAKPLVSRASAHGRQGRASSRHRPGFLVTAPLAVSTSCTHNVGVPPPPGPSRTHAEIS